jgi:hypothetical protein
VSLKLSFDIGIKKLPKTLENDDIDTLLKNLGEPKDKYYDSFMHMIA